MANCSVGDVAAQGDFFAVPELKAERAVFMKRDTHLDTPLGCQSVLACTLPVIQIHEQKFLEVVPRTLFKVVSPQRCTQGAAIEANIVDASSKRRDMSR